MSRKTPFNQVIAVECLTIVYIDKEIEQKLKEVEEKKVRKFLLQVFFPPIHCCRCCFVQTNVRLGTCKWKHFRSWWGGMNVMIIRRKETPTGEIHLHSLFFLLRFVMLTFHHPLMSSHTLSYYTVFASGFLLNSKNMKKLKYNGSVVYVWIYYFAFYLSCGRWFSFTITL